MLNGIRKLRIGIIGCGYISATYLRGATASQLLDVKTIADTRRDAALARAAEFGVVAVDVEALLRDQSIDIIVNLTTPQAHAQVSHTIPY